MVPRSTKEISTLGNPARRPRSTKRWPFVKGTMRGTNTSTNNRPHVVHHDRMPTTLEADLRRPHVGVNTTEGVAGVGQVPTSLAYFGDGLPGDERYCPYSCHILVGVNTAESEAGVGQPPASSASHGDGLPAWGRALLLVVVLHPTLLMKRRRLLTSAAWRAFLVDCSEVTGPSPTARCLPAKVYCIPAYVGSSVFTRKKRLRIGVFILKLA